MTNEEFQKLVLEKLGGIEGRIDTLEGRLGNLEEGQIKLEGRLNNLEEGQIKLEGRLNNLEEGQRKLEKGQEDIKRELRYIWDDIKRIDNRLEKQEIKLKKVSP